MSSIAQVYNGNYLETKLRIYKVEGTAITSDTTYESSSFSTDDYARFDNGTCFLSADYTYDPRVTTPRLTKTTSVNLETYSYGYQGVAYVLYNPQPTLSPGGFYTDTLRSADANTWIIHTVYITGTPTSTTYVPETVTDAYYTMP